MRFLRFCPVVLGLVALSGCHSAIQAPVQAADQRVSAENPVYNDTARFLAGLPGRPDSAFHSFEAQPAWQTYSKQIDELWAQVEKGQLQPLTKFQQRELASSSTGSSFVFYPFSGPDVLYGTAFFPQAKHYVMAAMEPAGSVRPVTSYNAEMLPNELHAWSNAMYSIFHRSFFVTGEMTRQFHGRVADGILPTMLLLLARSGHTVDGVQYVHLDEQGKLVVDSDTPLTPADHAHSGVEILFHNNEHDTQRRIIDYFSTDLGPGFVTNPSLARYLDSQGRFDTFIKSASFVPHWRMCDPLRAYMLKQSNLFVQDDTGVPYGYFKPAAWNVMLYGQYSVPDKPFRRHFQKDLAAAFHDPGRVRSLGFSLGYGYGRRPSSLIVAHRKETPPATATAATPNAAPPRS